MYCILCFVTKFEASANLLPILRSKCVISLDWNIVNPQMYCQYCQELCRAERIGRRESIVWIRKFSVKKDVQQLSNFQINETRSLHDLIFYVECLGLAIYTEPVKCPTFCCINVIHGRNESRTFGNTSDWCLKSHIFYIKTQWSKEIYLMWTF